MDQQPFQLRWPDENATQRSARQMAANSAIGNAFITLHGDLGAGKTTFVRHLLRALGVQGRIKSPTYAVVEPHEGVMPPGHATAESQPLDATASSRLPLAIWHFDFYRFSDPREWEDAGFRDLFAAPGLKLAEWPEKAAGHLPPPDLAVTIEAMPDDSRQVAFTPLTAAGLALAREAAA